MTTDTYTLQNLAILLGTASNREERVMSEQFVVAGLFDGTLNVTAVGPFRSEAKAVEVAERLEALSDPDERGYKDALQVIRLQTFYEVARRLSN